MRISAIVVLVSLVALSVSADPPQLSRQIFVQDDAGTQVVRDAIAGDGQAVPATTRDGVLWQQTIPGNIYVSCAAWDGQVVAGSIQGAACVANYFEAGSGGVPTWTFTGGENQAHGRAGVMAIVETIPSTQGVRLHAYDAASQTELWRKDYDNCTAPAGCLRVSDDGSVVALAVNTTTDCTIRGFAAATGTPLSSYQTATNLFARGLRLTADGGLIAVRLGATVMVLTTATGVPLWSGGVGASADPLSISPDGHWLASGWSTLYVWEGDGQTYRPRFTVAGSGWYLGTCAVADNGGLITGWYTTSYDHNRIEWYDCVSGATTWTYLFPVSAGSYQDLPVASANDGAFAVVGSWGDEADVNAEVNVFQASDPHPYFAVNTVGSIYDVDLTTVGPAGTRRLAACGKHVHANQFGNGGDLYYAEMDVATAIDAAPSAGALALNAFPNPFNPQCTLSLALPRTGHAQVSLYGADGRLVRNLFTGDLAAGRQDLVWDGCDDTGRTVPSGIYLARALVGQQRGVARLVLMR